MRITDKIATAFRENTPDFTEAKTKLSEAKNKVIGAVTGFLGIKSKSKSTNPKAQANTTSQKIAPNAKPHVAPPTQQVVMDVAERQLQARTQKKAGEIEKTITDNKDVGNLWQRGSSDWKGKVSARLAENNITAEEFISFAKELQRPENLTNPANSANREFLLKDAKDGPDMVISYINALKFSKTQFPGADIGCNLRALPNENSKAEDLVFIRSLPEKP